MKSGITMLIHNKNYIEFVTEFPCLLGHPVLGECTYSLKKSSKEVQGIRLKKVAGPGNKVMVDFLHNITNLGSPRYPFTVLYG